ncbi:hypothetical protein ABZW30_31115 [Kitasatospora sp. NPDC004669]|uniref:hypothetical protein n=1 Tax=Kitasatospora sp. NPDC004669 TaxID=3154555 RepID=UPI0033AAD7F9
MCFFQSAETLESRCAAFGFDDPAGPGEGAVRPVAFALAEVPPAVEERIGEVVERAVG